MWLFSGSCGATVANQSFTPKLTVTWFGYHPSGFSTRTACLFDDWCFGSSPLVMGRGKQRFAAAMEEYRQAAIDLVDASQKCETGIIWPVEPITIRARRARPESFQSSDIGLFGSVGLLRKNHLESPSV